MLLDSRFSGNSYRVHGSLLRKLRADGDLTQVELARLAGYSDRIIRKAEAGGVLRRQTLLDILAALEYRGVKATLTDVICDPLTIAKQYLACYECYQQRMLDHCSDLFADSFWYECAGDPASMPFAGHFEGQAGLQQWLDIYFSLFSWPDDCALTAAFVVEKTNVVARYHTVVNRRGRISPPLWVNLHFAIVDGLILSVRNEYDTQASYQFLRSSE